MEKPILFNSEMVRAILEGRKTQTRRMLKHQFCEWDDMSTEDIRVESFNPSVVDKNGEEKEGPEIFGAYDIHGEAGIKFPFGKPGDRLIVSMVLPISKLYCAGSNGKIYSKARGEWRELKPFKNQKGYLSVCLWIDNKKVTRHIHRLICEAFHGKPEKNYLQVRHLDGNPENNIPDNLCWGTQEENWLDRKAHGNGIAGENHHAAKFTNEERAHIRWALERGLCSQRGAARALGVKQSSIQQLMKGCELLSSFTGEAIAIANRIPLITLEITDVKVERLQDISEEDAKAEGVKPILVPPDGGSAPYTIGFEDIWQRIYGVQSWLDNPFCWAVEFKVLTKSTAAKEG